MFYVLIFISSLLWTLTQGQYATSCVLPNLQNGLCMPLESCKTTYELFNNIRNQGDNISDADRETLLRLKCGSMKSISLVCCDQSQIQLNPVGLSLLKNNTCGKERIDRLPKGRRTLLFGFSWMALLKYEDPIWPFQCTGSLISDQYVLTAAHCVSYVSNPPIAVRLGEHNIATDKDCMDFGQETICAPPVEDIGIEKIIKHENYTNDDIYHDIALLRLSRKVHMQRHINTICLPIYDHLRTKEYSNYIISGWGISSKEINSDVLQYAVVPKVDRGKCQIQLEMFNFRQNITVERICTGGGENYIDSCKADSGGPLGYKDLYSGNQRFIQFGILSAGVKKCESISAPFLYTNVSHYIQWITDNIY